MQEIEYLQKRWNESVHLGGLYANLSLEKDGLVLGAGTVLAGRDDDGALMIEGQESRMLTLLSVAHGRPIAASMLGAIRRASKHARAGALPMASMHLALAGLPRLTDPADAARRIFIADGLLARGVRPRDIFAALEFDPAPLDELEKYNPAEPRNPKGDRRISGEWTHAIEAAENAVEAVAEEAPRVVSRLASRITSVLEPFLDPLRAGGKKLEGSIPGRPDLHYSLIEGDLDIVRDSDGRVLLHATLGPGGNLYSGIPSIVPRAAGRDDPDMCPDEGSDRLGRPGEKGEKDRDFEDYMKLRVNPGNPTLRGMGYPFPKPWDPVNDIIFDDCQHSTGDLYDAKGTGYAAMLAKNIDGLTDGLDEKFITQAENQIAVSEGREIYWVFAEKKTMQHVTALFNDSEKPELGRIHMIYLYWQEGLK
jgi:hypothetical protein